MCALRQLPPIVLFVYNRPEHTRKTVEALAANDLALESNLFVFSDGAKKPEDTTLVTKVRNYIREVDGFKSVTIAEREQNYGLTKSIITGVTEIVNRFGNIIVLEDDLVTSPYFLKYMHDALQLYENEDRVAAIHGYTFPLNISLPETFFLRNTGCWGWGTWRRNWDYFEDNGKILLAQLTHRKLKAEFDLNGAYPYTRMLEDQANGKINTWDILWHASNFLENRLTLFPRISLVKNIGHDCSGMHCPSSSFYDVVLADTAINVSRIPIIENQRVSTSVEVFLRKGHSGFLRYWSWKLFGKSVTG